MAENVIQTIDLFPVLDRHLISLLKNLDEKDWNRPTLAKQWTVKDIASHLLDGNFRAISIYRDHFFGEAPPEIHSYKDLVGFLNELNGSWVKATKRLSPAVLTELLELTGNLYHEQLSKLNPFDKAVFSVAWAGEDVSANWFHIAREYTEKYHHQMQIREAVSATDTLLTPALFYPFIHTMLMGLPHTYRNTEAAENSAIKIGISSNAGGTWFLSREKDKWTLTTTEPPDNIVSSIIIPPDIAWKLFTKGLTPAEAVKEVVISGNAEIGTIALNMISVMA